MVKFSYNPFTDNLDMVGGGSSPGSSPTLSPYIVGPGNSDFAEPADAVEAAKLAGYDSSNPVNIYIKPIDSFDGGYLEEITGGDGINLVGFANCNPMSSYGDGSTGNSVTINAVYVHPADAKATLEGINFNSNILMQGGELFFNNCSFGGSIYLDSEGDVKIYFNNCLFNTESSPIFSVFALGSECTLKFLNCSSSGSFSENFTAGDAVLNITMESCSFSNDFSFSTTNQSFIYINDYRDLSTETSGSLFNIDSAPGSEFQAIGVVTQRGLGGFPEGAKISINNCKFNLGDTVFSDDTEFTSGQNINQFDQFSSQFYIGTRTGFNASNAHQAQGYGQTLDDTPTTIFMREMLNGDAIVLQGIIIGATADKTKGCGGTFMAVIRKEEDQAPDFVGTPTINVQSDSTATFQITFDNLAPGFSMVNLAVTGEAAETYDWVCYCNYIYLK